ncbi:MAG: toprim domain-containing protein [Tannerellaceae bacterium]|nr:toprim domain-containing protein [Tannerellaceae bacterium]
MEIKEIKSRLTIQTVLSHYNLEPDKNNMLCCPFHPDDTASMKVYPNTNTFNCFGCGKNGDQIEFCTLKEGSKHKGLLKATELCGKAPSQPSPKVKEPGTANAEISANENKAQNHTEILTRIFAYFQNGLNSSVAKRPKEYLQERGLSPLGETACPERNVSGGKGALELGYNSGQFHHRNKLSEEDLKACIEAGLLIPYKGSVPNANGTTYTTFAKDCIIFPLKDRNGNIVSLYGRSITNNDKSKPAPKGSGRHYYLKDRKGLYPNYPEQETTKLILTEAIIDAATLIQITEIVNEYEILSCYGTNGLTEEHKQAIKELQNLEEIIFFFDGDKAGTEAIEKYQKELSELIPGIKLSKVETPEGEDINSLSIAYEAEIFIHLLENRKDLFLLTEKAEEQESEPQQEPVRATGKLNTRNPEFITYTTEELQIIILGGINLQQIDRLRITLKISRTDTNDPLHSIRHTLDLYHSDYLEKFIGKACEQLETGTTVLKRAIAELTDQIEQYRLSKIESQKEQKPQSRQLTEHRQNKAINYLKAPKLMERTNNDIGRTGMIGEENNRLLMYLIFTSRLREQPLHIISLGASGTGKTYLQEKVSELIPEQEKLEITILSENAFYYFDRKELKHKLVLIEDMDGAQDVLYPLRELQSKKKISKTIPIKDSKGNLKTITLHVEGPICLAGTTTRENLYEDNSNRSLLIYLDGSNQQKEHIMEYQRRLSAGKVNSKEENELKEFFKDMQTVLKPIKVRNPYAERLKLPEYIFKPLRTNSHYLATIETITFYHQYQREIKTDQTTGERYIETTLEDIEWANILLKDVLLAKSDELPRAVREFFESLKRWIKKEKKENFFAKEVRERLRMYPMKVNRYMYELESRGFIRKTGGNRKTGFEYEIYRWDDYEKLQAGTDVMNEVLGQIRSKTRSVTVV